MTEAHWHGGWVRMQKNEQKGQKKERLRSNIQNMEIRMIEGNSKKAKNTLKALTKTQQHKSAVIKDSSGHNPVNGKHSCSEPMD